MYDPLGQPPCGFLRNTKPKQHTRHNTAGLKVVAYRSSQKTPCTDGDEAAARVPPARSRSRSNRLSLTRQSQAVCATVTSLPEEGATLVLKTMLMPISDPASGFGIAWQCNHVCQCLAQQVRRSRVVVKRAPVRKSAPSQAHVSLALAQWAN
jgi:hypothetical protein